MTTSKKPTRKERCDNLLRLFVQQLLPQLSPPPRITISEWAEANVTLSHEESSQPGPWRNNYAPYQKGIMDAISDPNVEKVCVMKAARVGITQSAVLNVIGHYIQNDPCPMFIVYPTELNAKRFSKKNLAPFLRNTKPLRGLLKTERSREGENTITLKQFNNGATITLVGANSPNSMRVDTAKIAIIDEADGEIEIKEGDYIKLVENRTLTYAGRGRKIIIISTPKDKGSSLIEAEYEESTKEKYHLPCPSCGDMQTFDFKRLDFESVLMACGECGAMHSKREWTHKWEHTGKWIAENPDATVRGFHLNALYSPFLSWEIIINEWRIANTEANAGQTGKLQVFINTYLGETWRVHDTRADASGLMERREQYYAEIPDGVCALTIGVDTQDNRLCYEVVGWGAGKESWGIEYGELWGDPRIPGSVVWGLLDDVIRKKRTYANGVPVPVVCVTIDMGGHAPDQVCTYAKARQGWNVWAVRGVGGQGKVLIHSTVRSKTASATVFNLTVDVGKDEIVARMKIPQPGPGYCHWPRGGSQDYTGQYESVCGYDERYFTGLTAEKKVSVKTKGGFHRYEWQKDPNQANEPFDCRNYAGAALEISKINLARIAEKAPWMTEAPAFDAPPRMEKLIKTAPQASKLPLNKRLNTNAYTAV